MDLDPRGNMPVGSMGNFQVGSWGTMDSFSELRRGPVLAKLDGRTCKCPCPNLPLNPALKYRGLEVWLPAIAMAPVVFRALKISVHAMM